MKKLLLFLLFLPCIAMSGERIKDISINFNKDDFSILVENNIAHISTVKYIYSYINDPVCPALPLVHINILIAPNEELIDYSCVMTEKKLLEEVFMIPRPKSIPTDANVENYRKDSIITYMYDTYPQELVRYIDSYNFNGYKYLTFELSPFKYDNINQTLYLEENYTLKLLLRTDASRNEMKVREADETIIRSLVMNPEDLRMYNDVKMANRQGQLATSQYEYVIITNNNLKPTFQKLANWKTLKGIKTKVLTVEEIYSTYPSSVSRQMKIKKTLKELYETNTNFKYALLAGDVDIVPAQMCHIEHTFYDVDKEKYVTYADDCPTDLFYACFNNMEWDTNNDNKIGDIDDNVSLSQNIAITRIPVCSLDDAETFVNRIISYESAPNIQAWKSNILMCGKSTYGIHCYDGKRMSDTHFKGEKLYKYMKAYYRSDTLSKVSFYDTGNDIQKENYPFNTRNLQTELSKGYTFVNLDSHGNYNGWETESTGYFSSDAEKLLNQNHTILVTSACHTNAFDKNKKCLSEAFLRNPDSGIIAYFGSSRQGWEYADSLELGESCIVNCGLFQKIFSSPNKNYGEMVRSAKNDIVSHCYSYNMAYRWLLFAVNPIGDPEMPIYMVTPQKFTKVSISFSNGALSINTGESDCTICVSSANDIGDSYYEVREGTNFSFSNLTDDYNICITKPGYIPYIARCGNTIYMQDELINTDLEVISNQMIIGSNITTAKPNGLVEINKGNTIIKSTNGVTINDSFEVNKGASLEIMTK